MNQLSNDRGKEVFANSLHREMFALFFFVSLIPALMISIMLFYLIFYITADQIGIPESIAYNILPAAKKVIQIMLLTTPLAITIILIIAHKVTHRIIGPFDRVVRELDECLSGQRKGPIMLRRNDKFWPLVEKINRLLERIPRT